jgi:hypothetical protein
MDIVYVKPENFQAKATIQIAEEIGNINKKLIEDKRPYILIGPGRWGSADRWLGIPVQWRDISGVGAIIELRNDHIKADPSQGSHFFHNMTSLGIHYMTVNEGGGDYLNWGWIESLPVVEETLHLRHVRKNSPLLLKIDGKKSYGVILDTD